MTPTGHKQRKWMDMSSNSLCLCSLSPTAALNFNIYSAFTDSPSLSCAILIWNCVTNFICMKALLGFLPVSPHLGSPNNVLMLVSFTALPLSGSTQKHINPRHWTSSKLPSERHLGISLLGLGLLECSRYRRWHSVKRTPETKRNNGTRVTYIDRVIKSSCFTLVGLHVKGIVRICRHWSQRSIKMLAVVLSPSRNRCRTFVSLVAHNTADVAEKLFENQWSKYVETR